MAPQPKSPHNLNGVQCTGAILVASEASEDMGFVDVGPPSDSSGVELLAQALGICGQSKYGSKLRHQRMMTFGPLWLAVAFLLSLAPCSISGWGINETLTHFWETLLSDPYSSTCNVDHSNMPMCVGGAQGPPQHFYSSSFTTIKVVDSIYKVASSR